MTDEGKPKREAWSSYPETILVFAGEPEMMVDLREQVPPATLRVLKAMGLGERFAVLTSYNPRGEDISAEENDRRFKELTAELRSAGLGFFVINACSPDRSHCECSVLLKVERDAAIAIAKRWEQAAIFWYDSGRFWIYGAISSIEPILLPLGS